MRNKRRAKRSCVDCSAKTGVLFSFNYDSVIQRPLDIHIRNMIEERKREVGEERKRGE